jgi:hypothetical protein
MNGGAPQEFDEDKAIFDNEVAKEKHRRRLEWFAALIVGVAFAVAIFGFFYFHSDQSAKSWCQTIFTTILGAATAYVLKSTPTPRQNPTEHKPKPPGG